MKNCVTSNPVMSSKELWNRGDGGSGLPGNPLPHRWNHVTGSLRAPAPSIHPWAHKPAHWINALSLPPSLLEIPARRAQFPALSRILHCSAPHMASFGFCSEEWGGKRLREGTGRGLKLAAEDSFPRGWEGEWTRAEAREGVWMKGQSHSPLQKGKWVRLCQWPWVFTMGTKSATPDPQLIVPFSPLLLW